MDVAKLLPQYYYRVDEDEMQPETLFLLIVAINSLIVFFKTKHFKW